MRPKGGKTDYKEPLIIRKGNSVLDVCNKLHRKLRKDFRFGLVWGKSVKFGGQRVGLSHILQDEDVLTIIKAKGTWKKIVNNKKSIIKQKPKLKFTLIL